MTFIDVLFIAYIHILKVILYNILNLGHKTKFHDVEYSTCGRNVGVQIV